MPACSVKAPPSAAIETGVDNGLQDQIDLGRNADELHALRADLQNREEQRKQNDRHRLVGRDHGNHDRLKIVIVADRALVKMLDPVNTEHADKTAHRAGDQHADQNDPVGLDARVEREAGVLTDELHFKSLRGLLHDIPD